MFDNTNELKEKQIKSESHLQELSDAVDFITKKFDKYEQEKKEREEIVNNLKDVDDLDVEKQKQYSCATVCYFMEFLKRDKKILTSCVSKL